MKQHPVLLAILTIGSLLAPPAGAQGPSRKYGDLLKRLPEHANALLLVDADALLDSPLGRREKWRERAADRPTGVLGVSTDVSKLAVAASVDLTSTEERWKIGMLATHASPPALTTLAAREGGYVEQLEAQNVAWTPRNFFLMSFPERIVGFAAPTDRQLLGGWLKDSLAKPRTFPPGWADRAIFRADAGAPIVLAVNLDKVLSPQSADVWLRSFHSESVKQNKINFELLAPRLADVKSAYLSVDVKETIEGTIRIDFAYSIDLLRPIAKELVLAAIADFGAHVEDFARWGFEAKGSTITMSGPLTEASVRRFLSFAFAPRLSPPDEPDAAASPPPSEPGKAARAPRPGGEPAADVALKATQQHYRAVVDIVRTLKSQGAGSGRNAKVWCNRAARQIEDLPLLNVDNEVLEWGSQVARAVREMASGINYASKDLSYRVAGTPNGYYNGYGNNKGYDASVLKTQSGAVLDVKLDGTWQALETSISDMRRKLVAKYKVEF